VLGRPGEWESETKAAERAVLNLRRSPTLENLAADHSAGTNDGVAKPEGTKTMRGRGMKSGQTL